MCGIRPWLALAFTCVLGNLVAKQLSIFAQWIWSRTKKKEEGILHAKYNLLHLLASWTAFAVVTVIFLILWSAIDIPLPETEASQEENSQV
jgi:hypothetical protein